MGSHPHDAEALPEPRTPAGRDALAAIIDRPQDTAVALDFDGTLAEIVPDPEQARAHPGAVPALAALAPRVGSVAVLTGRPAGVAVRYGGFAGVPGLEHLSVLGHYGAERWDAVSGEVRAPAPDPGVDAVRAELPGVLDAVGAAGRGSWIEEKGRAVAVHTRRADDPEAAFEALRAPIAELASRHGLIVEPGRLVLEVRPPGVDKGVALTEYVHERRAGAVLYAGDDLGDLAAYAAVGKLRSDGVPGLLLASGTEVPELAERADVVLSGPAAVVGFLAALAERLKLR
ncbi:trehalose-phosphatase [Streptomyces sp. SCSIO 30461]|uniref:trehalose-phosphatase n=1 Tax=Streptomyces sp. SCSIO 30461 TaxID=3118085 RepID=UPI0030D5FDA3